MLEWLPNTWSSIAQFFSSLPWGTAGVWTLSISLLIVGFVGAIVPFLPGPMLIVIAGIVHTLLLPEQGMSTWGIVLLIVWFCLAYAVDFFSGMMGARWFGASRWGITGVFIGGIVGLFFGPLGLLLGPLVGGFAFEMLFANGTAFSEVDYDVSGTEITGFPSALTGKFIFIQFSENNYGVPCSNITNTVAYSVNGALSYSFANNPLAFSLYANGALLAKGSSYDYTANSAGYTLTSAINNNYTLLNNQTYARDGAA